MSYLINASENADSRCVEPWVMAFLIRRNIVGKYECCFRGYGEVRCRCKILWIYIRFLSAEHAAVLQIDRL